VAAAAATDIFLHPLREEDCISCKESTYNGIFYFHFWEEKYSIKKSFIRKKSVFNSFCPFGIKKELYDTLNYHIYACIDSVNKFITFVSYKN
jgi:hypothetical protein